MLIRNINKADNLVIKTIIQDSLKKRGFDLPGTAYFDPQLDDLTHHYQSLEAAAYWVTEIDQQVIGGVGIAPYSNGICELQKLYIKDNFQGYGYANHLMEVALAFAAQHYQACYLETLFELSAACKLYEKFGFHLLNKPLPGSEHSAMDAWYFLSFEKAVDKIPYSAPI